MSQKSLDKRAPGCTLGALGAGAMYKNRKTRKLITCNRTISIVRMKRGACAGYKPQLYSAETGR